MSPAPGALAELKATEDRGKTMSVDVLERRMAYTYEIAELIRRGGW